MTVSAQGRSVDGHGLHLPHWASAPASARQALLRTYTSVDANHVIYLQGSPLRREDRDRAAVSTASAAFVLANKQSDDPVEEDENTILTGLALKQHLMGISQRVWLAGWAGRFAGVRESYEAYRIRRRGAEPVPSA